MDLGIVTLILNIVLIVFVFLGILFGFIRGFKKAGVRLVLFIISIIAAGILAPIISNVIMNVTISTTEGTFTLNNYIIHMLASSPEIAEIMSLEALKNLIQQLPLLFTNLVLFLILIYVVGLIGYICYTIISHILFKKKVNKNPEYTLKNNKPVLIENNTKQKKFRLLGGLIGGAQGLLLLFFTLVPLGGLVKTFNQILEEPVSAEEVVMPESMADYLKANLPPEVLQLIDAYNNSIYGKINNNIPLTDICFDSISSIKVNGEKIVLRQEINTVVEIYDNLAFLTNLDLSTNIENLDFDKIEKAINLVFDVKTLKAIIPDLIPYLLKQLKVEDTSGAYAEALNIFIDEMITYFEEQPDVAETLKSDLLAVVGIARVCVESGLVTELSKETIDQEKVLGLIKGEDGNFNTPKQVINNFFNSNTIKKLLAEGCNFAIVELEGVIKTIVPETERENVYIGRIDYSKINWSSISESFLEMFKSAFGIYEEIKDLNFEENYNIILSQVDAKKVLVNAGNIIDKIKELAIFSATSDNTNIYNNIMVQLNKTKLGDYFDFTKSSINGFWVSNMTAVANLFEVEQEIMAIFDGVDIETVTDYQYYIDQIDFNKYEKAIESLCDCSLFTIISDDAVENFKHNILDKELNLDTTTFEGKLITNLVTNLSNSGNIVNEIKAVLKAQFNIIKAFAQSGIINSVMNDNVNIANVLIGLKKQNEDGETLIDVITDGLFSSTAIKSIFVDTINYGLEKLEKDLIDENIVSECDLGRIDYSNVDWDTVTVELKTFFNDLLNFDVTKDNFVIGNRELPGDMSGFIKAVGQALQDLRDFSPFQISSTNNIFDNIVTSVKDMEEIKSYVDLSVLLEDDAIVNEFTYVANIFDNLVESELFSYLANSEEFTYNDFVNISKKFVEKVQIDNTEKTRIAIILDQFFESRLVNNILHSAFESLDKELQNSIPEISKSINGADGELVEISNINIDALDDKNENAKVIATFENLFTFISSFEGNIVDNKINIKTFINSDLAVLGSYLDSLSNLKLLKAVDGSTQKGLYQNMIDILIAYSKKESLDSIIDFSVVKQEDFTWNNELVNLQSSIKAMYNIEIEIDVEGVPTTSRLIDCLDDINNILKINPEKIGDLNSEVYEVLYGVLDSNLFKPIGAMLVDTVNDIVESMLGIQEADKAPDFTAYDSIKEQKLEIIKIVENYIKANNANVFDKVSKINEMTDTEITLFGDLLNSFKENAYRTENSGVTGEGVFKTAYDNLLNAYSEYANLLDKYERKLDVDWISILKIARTLGSQEEIQINSETVEELKPQVIEILTTIYGEEETRDLTTKIDDIVTSLENFENSDSAVLEEKVDALLENVANVEIVVDLLETLDVTIPVIDSTTITEEVVNNKIDALEISDKLKASLKNIFGVNVGV